MISSRFAAASELSPSMYQPFARREGSPVAPYVPLTETEALCSHAIRSKNEQLSKLEITLREREAKLSALMRETEELRVLALSRLEDEGAPAPGSSAKSPASDASDRFDEDLQLVQSLVGKLQSQLRTEAQMLEAGRPWSAKRSPPQRVERTPVQRTAECSTNTPLAGARMERDAKCVRVCPAFDGLREAERLREALDREIQAGAEARMELNALKYHAEHVEDLAIKVYERARAAEAQFGASHKVLSKQLVEARRRASEGEQIIAWLRDRVEDTEKLNRAYKTKLASIRASQQRHQQAQAVMSGGQDDARPTTYAAVAVTTARDPAQKKRRDCDDAAGEWRRDALAPITNTRAAVPGTPRPQAGVVGFAKRF